MLFLLLNFNSVHSITESHLKEQQKFGCRPNSVGEDTLSTPQRMETATAQEWCHSTP